MDDPISQSIFPVSTMNVVTFSYCYNIVEQYIVTPLAANDELSAKVPLVLKGTSFTLNGGD